MLTLNRNGERDGTFPPIRIDELYYTYDEGNQLQNVFDKEGSPEGYNDFHIDTTEPDFEYDGYGNLISDKDKEIKEIFYNHLNLPIKIFFENGGGIEYFYDASGTKMKKEVREHGEVSGITEYMDGFHYDRGLLNFFPHAEGYVKVIGERERYDFQYVFQYKDHLGSVRLSYSDYDFDGTIDIRTEVVQENNYYPFGLEHKGYNNVVNGTENNYQTFQGQEINKELGLNWLSFKYRNYDPAIGRFFNIDPLTEDYMDWGPYVFSGNRVIDARELEGLEPYVVTGRSFIPDKTVSNPMPFSKTKSFGGDGRSNYQLNTTAYRTEQKVRVDFDNNKATTLSNRANSTTGYDKNGNATETSKPGKAGPTPTYTMDGNTATVNMEVDASNKLVDVAPAINYDVGVTITQGEDGSFSFELKGESDGFPAYEFFITNEKDGNSYQIYGSNPNKTGDTPWALLPPMEKNINVSGNSTTTKPIEEKKNN